MPAKTGGDVTDPRDVSAKHRKSLEAGREEPAGASGHEILLAVRQAPEGI